MSNPIIGNKSRSVTAATR